MNRLKALSLALCPLLLAGLLTGCLSVNFNGSGHRISSALQGEGAVITQEYSLGDFTAVTVNATIQVIYSNRPESRVELEVFENHLPYYEVGLNDGRLTVTALEDLDSPGNFAPKLYIYSDHLEELDVRGAVSLEQADTISGDAFSLVIGGVCSAKLNLDVEQLNVQIAGTGSVDLTGSARQMNLNLSGMASVDAFRLETEDAVVNMSGMGSADIWCTQSLDASLSGMGGLSYKGDPANVIQNVSGMGSVRRA